MDDSMHENCYNRIFTEEFMRIAKYENSKAGPVSASFKKITPKLPKVYDVTTVVFDGKKYAYFIPK